MTTYNSLTPFTVLVIFLIIKTLQYVAIWYDCCRPNGT